MVTVPVRVVYFGFLSTLWRNAVRMYGEAAPRGRRIPYIQPRRRYNLAAGLTFIDLNRKLPKHSSPQRKRRTRLVIGEGRLDTLHTMAADQGSQRKVL
jgi:hypothetical protein